MDVIPMKTKNRIKLFLLSTFLVVPLFWIFPLCPNKAHKISSFSRTSQFPLVPRTRQYSQELADSLQHKSLPLYFIPNKGQMPSEALFCVKSQNISVWFTKDGFVFDDNSRLFFLKAKKNVRITPAHETEHKVSYISGNKNSRWVTQIPSYQKIVYSGIYPQIDLEVSGDMGQLEYDFIVNPGGDVSEIIIGFSGAEETRIDKNGNLLVRARAVERRHLCPVAYQIIEGRMVGVKAEFKKMGENTYGFALGKYNPHHELIIDPLILAHAEYLGGGHWDRGMGLAVDAEGAVYITGYTDSSDFPTDSGAFDTGHNGNYDVWFFSRLVER
jgi:hypothetical protein